MMIKYECMPKGQTIIQRIMNKIVVDENDCWVWVGSRFKKKYGDYSQIRIGTRANSKLKRGHVVSYEEFIGEIPKGKELDHLCKNTLCVNPNHLQPVTHRENIARRKDSGLSHCKHGHKYTKKTTYIRPDNGRRECRVCRRLRRRIDTS